MDLLRHFVGDGAHTEEGAWVVTSQVFEFTSDTVGGQTIVTHGFETPQLAGPAVRAVAAAPETMPAPEAR